MESHATERIVEKNTTEKGRFNLLIAYIIGFGILFSIHHFSNNIIIRYGFSIYADIILWVVLIKLFIDPINRNVTKVEKKDAYSAAFSFSLLLFIIGPLYILLDWQKMNAINITNFEDVPSFLDVNFPIPMILSGIILFLITLKSANSP